MTHNPELEDQQISNQTRATVGGAHASFDGGRGTEIIQGNYVTSPQPEKPRTFAGATKPKVQEWRSEYGEDRVRLSSVPVGAERLQFVVHAPSRADYDRYVAALAKAERDYNKMTVATRNLFAACLLAPSIDEVRAVWERYPALADKMSEPILMMAGMDAEVREETF